MLSHSVVLFLLVGGLAFLVDVGLLALFHEVLRIPLAVATPVAFLLSFAFTFLMQRSVTFKTDAGVLPSAIKYTLLVAFNTVATTLMVEGWAQLGWGWVGGKVLAVGSTTVWNYFLYRYWIFPGRSSASGAA